MGALALAGAVVCFQAQGALMLAGGLVALVIGCGWLSADWVSQVDRSEPIAIRKKVRYERTQDGRP